MISMCARNYAYYISYIQYSGHPAVYYILYHYCVLRSAATRHSGIDYYGCSTMVVVHKCLFSIVYKPSNLHN